MKFPFVYSSFVCQDSDTTIQSFIEFFFKYLHFLSFQIYISVCGSRLDAINCLLNQQITLSTEYISFISYPSSISHRQYEAYSIQCSSSSVVAVVSFKLALRLVFWCRFFLIENVRWLSWKCNSQQPHQWQWHYLHLAF